ncbi:MAG: hypothetical protein A2286_14300 [Gammaproteobacteria bacterium RIFOXYA12_FULL_61_12]|nr:MAG: hypothetical protein A2286_14300 [Gammaproteobacteria bacterium RIFOXYA12_FULL_61_12]OGT89633.1 MAG: hypothetical protein A2514_14640 [Gammaproteobacteria bacterium RIFOXYD12_FULL_61_37]
MSEGLVERSSDYGQLIEEVFIDPIRTVVVVDDDYPTLDALLDKELGTSQAPWDKADTQRAREIMQFCHGRERPWLVEIHDGRLPSLTAEATAATHLHHSDLMILDYHLDKQHPSDGGKAIEILRSLAGNDHFNLVIVYTKGNEEQGGDISRVVQEIAVGLCTADTRFVMGEQGAKRINELLDEWEDERESIRSELMEWIGDATFVKARGIEDRNDRWQSICSWPELDGLKALLESAPPSVKAKKLEFKLALKWAFDRKQAELTAISKLSQCDYGNVDFDSRPDGTNWIRTDRLFVTVVSKEHQPDSLPSRLLTALQSWDPEPHRLLMSKMRAELDERGVLAEGKVLDKRLLQAGWLGELLVADPDRRTWNIHNAIGRHWEGLGDAIRADVTDFADRLASHLMGAGPDGAISRWYGSPIASYVACHLNRHACSKPVEGVHLTTGHVLQIESNLKAEQYWLCMSPACDLVPGQKKWGKGNFTPFAAVSLTEARSCADTLSDAADGNNLFLEIGGVLRCFRFVQPPKTQDGRIIAAHPKWEQMFAADMGKFGSINKSLSIARTSGNGDELGFNTCAAIVVAQLRYEYAINLLHRFGSTLSRVGLDFVGMTATPAGNGQTHP